MSGNKQAVRLGAFVAVLVGRILVVRAHRLGEPLQILSFYLWRDGLDFEAKEGVLETLRGS